VQEQLDLDPNEPISEEDLRELNFLMAMGRGIKKLDGLEKAANLRILWLEQNEIRDISPLAELTELDRLILPNNKIEDITPLAGLKQLTHLELEQTRSRTSHPSQA